MAYPNPFRSELILEIATPNRAPAEWAVYDVTGHKIWSGIAPAGAARHQWDGRDRSGRLVPSGTYFYRLQSGAHEATGRIVKVP
jgi:CHU_C Type IX secretion signal domain